MNLAAADRVTPTDEHRVLVFLADRTGEPDDDDHPTIFIDQVGPGVAASLGEAKAEIEKSIKIGERIPTTWTRASRRDDGGWHLEYRQTEGAMITSGVSIGIIIGGRTWSCHGITAGERHLPALRDACRSLRVTSP